MEKTNINGDLESIARSRESLNLILEKFVDEQAAFEIKNSIMRSVGVQCGSFFGKDDCVVLISENGKTIGRPQFKNRFDAELFFCVAANYIKINNSHLTHSLDSENFKPFPYFLC